MPQAPLTDAQVGLFVGRLGNYRVKRVQAVALEGEADGISGALLLAMGLRETHLQNIEGGARYDEVAKKWVAEWDYERMDVGWIQINRRWHSDDLKKMPGVAAGTWTPVVAGKTAYEGGYVPRFEDSLQFTLRMMHESMAYGDSKGVPPSVLPRFAVAAHNAGVGGAMDGYRSGDVDKNTAKGDYSAWVISTKTQVNRWLNSHPKWKV